MVQLIKKSTNVHNSKETYLTKRDKLTEIDHLKMYLPLVDPWLLPPSNRKLLLIYSPFHKDFSSNSSTTPPAGQKWTLFRLSLPFSPHCILRLRERCERNVAVYQKTGARYFVTLCHVKSRDVDNFLSTSSDFFITCFSFNIYWFKAITDEWLKEVDNRRN